MATRIVLVDDHGIMRQGLRSMLNECENMEVVGEAADGREALDVVKQSRPDVVVTDFTMPNLNGADATRVVLKEFPHVKVIALSVHSDTMFVSEMLRAGASGYVLKDCLFQELVEAIETVGAGGTYLSPRVAGVVVEGYISQLDGGDPTKSPLEALTVREREVLQMIAEGKTTKQIALVLHVSTKAIEANRRRIMDKLDAHSIAELVKCAILGGLASLET